MIWLRFFVRNILWVYVLDIILGLGPNTETIKKIYFSLSFHVFFYLLSQHSSPLSFLKSKSQMFLNFNLKM